MKRALPLLVLLPSLARADLPELPPTKVKSGHATQMVAAWTASVSIVTAALALVGIAVFEKYDGVVNGEVQRIADENQGLAGDPKVAAWFATPDCEPPEVLMGETVMHFKDDCTARSRWITASVVLFVITGTLLVTAAVSEGIGLWQDSQAYKQLQLVPTVSRDGAGAMLTLRF